jgi:SAM-dependent methyltransferase
MVQNEEVIYVFFHVYTINDYQEIFNEIVNKLFIHSDKITKFFVCVVGDKKLDVSVRNLTCEVKTISTSYSACEIETLNYMREVLSSSPKNAKVLYLHTKGVTHSKPNFTAWRKYMTYFNVEQMNKCIAALNDNDTCGVDLRHGPVTHYSGNFWWANSSYLLTLKNVNELPHVISHRHKAEFWVCSGNGKHHCIYDDKLQKDVHTVEEFSYKTYEPGNLGEILTKYGSDKASIHTYDIIYEKILSPLVGKSCNILEIGVKTGGSLLAWKEFLVNANVYGVELSEEYGHIYDQMRKQHGVNIFMFDSTIKKDSADNFKDIQFDVIIDDGSHHSPDQKKTFYNLLEFLKPGGIYVIEDIQCVVSARDDVFYKELNWEVIDNRHIKGRYDDVVSIYRKP